jgi:replicative DNA helicase
MNLHDMPQSTEAIHAEQSVIGALLIDNDAIDRIGDLTDDHFYNNEHRLIFAEICKQIGAGKRCDVISLFEVLRDKINDCLPYLNQIAQNTGSAANIGRYAEIVTDRAVKRAIVALGREMQEGSAEPSEAILDRLASKVDALAQKKTKQEPQRMADMLTDYVEVIQARMEGKIKPIKTGFADLDSRLDGGLERGTLTVVAGRPGMGKTAFGLCIARNVAEWGTAAFLSMEMDKDQVSDRNVAALGHIPVKWLRNPNENTPEDKKYWDNMTHAFAKAQELNIYIDDQTALNMLEIRNKARSVKRRSGLDALVIDQLSFITGGSREKKNYELIGEYTRGLIALAKELKIAVILLCQLNRECETRPNKRPQMSDLAMSGSIEQDAANIIFLYRDEIYNPDSPDKGICEVNSIKQRQGEPGIVALTYIGNQTRFENLAFRWQPPTMREKPKSRGFD